MIVDTSALIAILRAEPEAEVFSNAITLSDQPAMSAASYLEAAVIVDRRGGAVAQQFLDQVIKTLRIEIVPFTLGQALWARSAYRRFGKGSGHPAQLNFGDCMSYALAAERRQPILFKGGDFTQTDLEPAF